MPKRPDALEQDALARFWRTWLHESRRRLAQACQHGKPSCKKRHTNPYAS